MSDAIKHECGIALLRLRKTPDYYFNKYQTSFYGLNKLYLLMEKQHNRGQDGAGVANIKIGTAPGKRFISRVRSNNAGALKEIFSRIHSRFEELQRTDPDKLNDPQWLKEHVSFTGELFLGHLRYGTYGENSIESCHPFLRLSNWKSRNLVVAGNFNLTNVDELFGQLVELGQHPKEKADTVTVMERIGHFLDLENDRKIEAFRASGEDHATAVSNASEQLDIQRILKESSKKWDGGYCMAGLIGNGDSFVLRDPNGIRPCYYYVDEEVAVVCSERPVIQTAFRVESAKIKELEPGSALIIKADGSVSEMLVNTPGERRSCSFERIYFSRGSDESIYKERKKLGVNLVEVVQEAIARDFANTVFSYIPNTAEVAFLGLIKGIEKGLIKENIEVVLRSRETLSDEAIRALLMQRARVEKIAIKDAKLRTFITNDTQRRDMVEHVYDITYGTIRAGVDNLVILDDSIVRGTTLRNSIIRMLSRLKPKQIIIVSSAPQIRYPDCYGIDMAKLGDFIAFQAAVFLHEQRGTTAIIRDAYHAAREENQKDLHLITNVVKRIYQPFTSDELSEACARLLTPEDIDIPVKVLFQSLEGLHEACPDHRGDWYFSGDYPTHGGNRVANQSLINYVEKKHGRAY